MNTIKFEMTGNINKIAKAYIKLTDFSRKGIVKAFVENKISDLNIVELCAIYDDVHVGRADFVPEFFPKYSGKISIEKSKEFWGEYWSVIFGENGEHWGKDLHEAKDINYWKVREAIEKLEEK